MNRIPGTNTRARAVLLRAAIAIAATLVPAVGAPGQHPQPDHNPLYPEGEAYVYRVN